MAGRLRIVSPPLTQDQLDGLPDPVRRYFLAAIMEGQPAVAAARLSQVGCLNMSDNDENWRHCASTQLVVTTRPGFHWNARISMAPGLQVYVRDSYVAQAGLLHATLLGIVTVADLRDTPELAQAELMRFLAEAVWYPTVLIPGNGVRWQPVDDVSAQASLGDGANRATLDFEFKNEGLISTVRAHERYRYLNGKFVPTTWQGRFSEYAWRDGMRIPLRAEVEWVLPDGRHPYWRGRIGSVCYEWVD